MITFLGQAADYIFKSHHLNQLQNLKVVLPSRRAALYFKKALALLSAEPFFSPSILSIDDFIQETSGLRKIDTVELYFEIFEIWKKHDESQSFEKFLTWVPTLLKDFNLIDSSLLANPEKLFKYMSETEALSRWELGNNEHNFSENALNYFSFFDKMSLVYTELKESLISKRMSYSGLTYRMAYEKSDELLNDDGLKYYFVGLNALSVAEEKIIQKLSTAQKAMCLWDSDSFYMNTNNKAGKKLRDYKINHKFGKEWLFQANLLASSEKNIEIFETPSVVLQSKLTSDLIQKSKAESHAIIVLDESDFTSLFIQLPALDLKYNISAGIAFKSSGLAAIVNDYTKLLDFPGKNLRSHLIKGILNNPYLQGMVELEIGAEKYREIQSNVQKVSHLYVSKDALNAEFAESFTLSSLLKINSPSTFLIYLKEFLEKFIENEAEEAPLAHELIGKLNILRAKLLQSSNLNKDAFLLLLKELTKNISSPFEKKPDAKIQVMSMLETRCLDFEEVTFVSLLEGNLPSGKKNNSFIPFDALQEFELPSYSDQDAIMAYHFLRILQRAKKVNFIYPKQSGTGVGRKEKSRFIYQIENELVNINSKLTVSYPKIAIEGLEEKEISENIEIRKTSEILEKTKIFLAERGFSPTALSAYFTSKLGFYWKYIENIAEKEDDTLHIGSNTFGNIIHFILESIDKPYVAKKELITKDILRLQKKEALDNFDIYLAEYQKKDRKKYDYEYGLNHVLKTVARELLGKYFDTRIREHSSDFTVVGIEKKINIDLDIDGQKVKLKGTIDKIERHNNEYVIIDYKTGEVKKNAITIKHLDEEEILSDKLKDNKFEKFRQLLIYNFLLRNQNAYSDLPFQFKFYSFRSLNEDLVLDAQIFAENEKIEAIEELLKEVVVELLDVEKPFKEDEDNKIEKFSDYYNLLSI